MGLTIMSLLYAPGILMYIKGKEGRNDRTCEARWISGGVHLLAAAVASVVLSSCGRVVLAELRRGRMQRRAPCVGCGVPPPV